MRWRRFLFRQAHARDRAEEMHAHVALLAEELVSRGVAPEDAERQARLAFGNPRVKLEEVDAMNRVPLLDTLYRDVRYAVRALRATPSFTVVALLVVALGIGASTSIFSVVDAVSLRGLPFERGDRLVAVGETIQGVSSQQAVTAPNYLDWRTHPDIFDGLAAARSSTLAVRPDGDRGAESLVAQRVNADFFSVLRVKPMRGRPLMASDEIAGQEHVAVISYGLWQRYFGGSTDVLGQWLRTTQDDVQVVGVMPASFTFPLTGEKAFQSELWMPYVVPSNERERGRSRYNNLRLIGRLRDGVSIAQAQARLDDVNASLAAAAPDWFARRGVSVIDYREYLTGRVRSWMLMLLGAVACVLLIAFVNVANLMLVRATTRSRELGIRAALGASRWTLTRQLLVEGVMLSTAGAVIGVVMAWWGVALLRAALPAAVPRIAAIGIDLRVLAAAICAALIAGVAFGLTPIALVRRLQIADAFRDAGRSHTSSRHRQWLRSALLVSEVALALVLVIGAGLFVTSFSRLMRVDLGLDPRNVLTVSVIPPAPSVSSSDQQARAAASTRLMAGLQNITNRLRGVSGIEAVALSEGATPLSGAVLGYSLTRPGRTTPPGTETAVDSSNVSPEYFKVMDIPLRQGRLFSEQDRADSQPVVILDETAVRRFFGDEDPIGQLVQSNGDRIVVGVVGDIRRRGPESDTRPTAFMPFSQATQTTGMLMVKTVGDPMSVLPAVTAAVRTEYPNISFPPAQTLEQHLQRLIAPRQFNMRLLALFGLLGVVIAAVGIYGVMAYIVAQRTREIGIRIALGAKPAHMIWSVQRRAAAHLGLGMAIGLAASWSLAGLVKAFLFKVEPHDISVYAGGCALLLIAGLLAAWLPALRAARVDPLVALRTE